MTTEDLDQHVAAIEQEIHGLDIEKLDPGSRRGWTRSLREIANQLDPDRQPFQPSQELKDKAWMHLTHEVQALEQQGSEYLRLNAIKHGDLQVELTAEPPRQRVINALLDASYMHARALDEFLYSPSEKVRRDTMLGKQFEDAWPQQRPASPLLAGNGDPLRERINKMIVHLSYDRIGMYRSGKKWNVSEIMEEMCAPLSAFADLVASNPPAADFCRAERHFCKLHG